MKNKISLLILSFLIVSLTSFSQVFNDSVRTRNDKPGTPQSLRTPDKSPQSKVTILNTNSGANQNVIHTSSESSNTNYNNGSNTIIPVNSNRRVPKTPITLKTTKANPADSLRKTSLGTKVSNASNPIRN